ncbi:transcription factor TFIIE [Vulcanisaeta sp. JCM 14467]|uniref:transcription factor TFIIE n=1 Tax=Vulcanisaeta sp. JCM 14467 TaxID=1295370 RepID=UPI0006D17290|nr:transcription factor TFIIE [Vulcanisaeta sp. JCM 14467]
MVEDLETSLFLEYARRRIAFEYDNEEMGELAVKILRTLSERNEAVSDETLALVLGISATEIRRILHVMHKAGLVGLARESTDQYRYEYKWFVNKDFIRRFLVQHVNKVTSKLMHRINALSTTTLYICPTCFRSYTLDETYEYDFRCPRDDTELVQADVSSEITFLTNVIKNLRREEKE